MCYMLTVEAALEADPVALWQTRTDLPQFPEWDPRDEEASFAALAAEAARGRASWPA